MSTGIGDSIASSFTQFESPKAACQQLLRLLPTEPSADASRLIYDRLLPDLIAALASRDGRGWLQRKLKREDEDAVHALLHTSGALWLAVVRSAARPSLVYEIHPDKFPVYTLFAKYILIISLYSIDGSDGTNLTRLFIFDKRWVQTVWM